MASLPQRLGAQLAEARAALARQQAEVDSGLRTARESLAREHERDERLRERLDLLDGAALQAYRREDLRALLRGIAEHEAKLATLRASLNCWEYRQLALAEQAHALDRLAALIDEALDTTTASALAAAEWLRAQDAERSRLAGWLHDRVAQPLHTLVLHLDLAGRWLKTDPARAADELAAVPALAARLLQGVRRVIFELRPMSLDDLGLVPTLERHIQLRAEEEGFITRLQVRGRPRRLAPAVELGVFRSVIAALDQVRERAGVEALLSLTFGEDELVVTVAAAGRDGDRPALDGATDRLGRLEMQVRVRELGGSLSVATTAGQGTSVRLVLPLATIAAAGPPGPSGRA